MPRANSFDGKFEVDFHRRPALSHWVFETNNRLSKISTLFVRILRYQCPSAGYKNRTLIFGLNLRHKLIAINEIANIRLILRWRSNILAKRFHWLFNVLISSRRDSAAGGKADLMGDKESSRSELISRIPRSSNVGTVQLWSLQAYKHRL